MKRRPACTSPKRKPALVRLLEQEKIRQAQVAGIAEPFYFRSQDKPWLDRTLEMDEMPRRAVVMAPLHNLLWDRRMLKELFDFDYRWEVYVPADKRRYGYYVLPILYGDRFIARFEPGNDKKRSLLTIKNWWWETGINPSGRMKADLVGCFGRFLEYLGANRLQVDPQVRQRAGLEWLEAAFSQGPD